LLEKEVQELNVVGKNLPLIDGPEKVTGRAKYVADMKLPRMLYGSVLRSPYPHADVLRIDTGRAKLLQGVKAVITPRDLPDVRYNSAERFYGQSLPATEVILTKRARFVGDRIAAVAAETPEIAEKALTLIDVSYRELPAIYDPEEALADGAPEIHPGGNLASRVNMSVGDVQRGFEESDALFEGRYKTDMIQHVPLETHACLCDYNEAGRLTVWTPTQTPFPYRFILSRALLIPVGKIRVIKPFAGGGYGAKNEIVDEPVCAALAVKTCRPVKMVMTRKEEFVASRTRHSAIIDVKTGVMKDGKLHARRMRAQFNTGAYCSGGPMVTAAGGSKSFALYKIPSMEFEGLCIYTNNPIAGAFRGYGNAEDHFATETQMDEIANELGLDPVEFRLMNLVRPGDRHAYSGINLGNMAVRECVMKGAETIQWAKTRGLPSQLGSIRRGVGMACAVHTSGAVPAQIDFSSAVIKVNEDGSVNFSTGTADLGTGSDTALAQIVAEELGVLLEDVKVEAADTDTTPFDMGAYGSRSLFVGGFAAKEAAHNAKVALLKEAATILNEPVHDLIAKNRRIYSQSNPAKSVSIAEVSLHANVNATHPHQIIGVATASPKENPPPYAAHFVEAEVDLKTGKVTLLRVVAVHDSGRPISPINVEGQIEGAIAMGIGSALTERLKLNEKGEVTNPNLKEYRVVKASEMPQLNIILLPNEEPLGPYQAKSAGEIGIIPVAPAIINAVNNALGTRLRQIPATPERILQAISK
jgi:CO/xanthine dehydrogenase Mo-binding subunit